MYKHITKKNVTRSRGLASQYEQHIQPNQCYTNISRIAYRTDYLFEHPDLRIAYGVVHTPDERFYCRHAFLYDTVTEEVIDPTLPEELNSTGIFRDYYIYVEMDYIEYLKITSHEQTADAWDNSIIREKLKEFEDWGVNNGVVSIGK